MSAKSTTNRTSIKRAKRKRSKVSALGKRPKNAKSVVLKGGDGSTYVKPSRGQHWKANSRVYLTGGDITDGVALGAFIESLMPTADLGDRAHSKKRLIVQGLNDRFDDSWMLVPMCELSGRGRRLPGRVRRYHPSQMTSSGVAFDSMFDRLARVAANLQAAGIEMGMRTMHARFSSVEHERAMALSGLPAREADHELHQQTTQEQTPEERKLDRKASRLIKAAERSGGAS